ncbi:MAG: class I SAM-dependent methyltransferase [Acidobacteriia bacterium]|nr:class I SAM-dependent methyltransferase [Terriglobia bacterium]
MTSFVTPGVTGDNTECYNSKMQETVSRFSNRAENYWRYRPGYPVELVEFLSRKCGLNRSSVIADIGSGTGILSELFLKNGNPVIGVEPNDEMRQVAELLLKNYPHFTSLAGTAEKTTLPSAGIDFVTAGQAFHWFDQEAARLEFIRILKPEGWLAVTWNGRRTGGNRFLVDYEKFLLKHGTDYAEVKRRYPEAAQMSGFFRGEFKHAVFGNRQILGFEGLKGRALSASYVPTEGHPKYPQMLAALKDLFEKHVRDGKIVIEYDTHLYCASRSSMM